MLGKSYRFINVKVPQVRLGLSVREYKQRFIANSVVKGLMKIVSCQANFKPVSNETEIPCQGVYKN